jgi:hypothetical protein
MQTSHWVDAICALTPAQERAVRETLAQAWTADVNNPQGLVVWVRRRLLALSSSPFLAPDERGEYRAAAVALARNRKAALAWADEELRRARWTGALRPRAGRGR